MPMRDAMSLGRLELGLPRSGRTEGSRVFAALVEMAQEAVKRLRKASPHPVAAVSRLRGTGRGCSLSAMLDAHHRIKGYPNQAAPFSNRSNF